MNDPFAQSQPPTGPQTHSADGLSAQDPFTEPVDETVGFGSPVGEPSKPRISKATLAMIGLFAVGVIVVGVLSMRGGPRQASAEDQAAEQKVDSFIQKSQKAAALTRNLQDTRKVVGTFYDYASRRQVPVEDLQANPFVFGDDKPTEPKARVDPAPRVAGQRKATLDAAVGKLKLQSVMMGPRGGTAIINNQFVAEGHTVDEFTVRRIAADRVELTCDGMLFTLLMRQ